MEASRLLTLSQQFSDDEGEVDEPLAPLPDEPEVVDGDEDLEQDETRNDASQAKDLADMDTNLDDPPSKVPSPKPQLMMLQSSVDDETQDPTELDSSLKPIGIDKEGPGVEGLELDISGLGPDGLQLENAHDLSQLDGPDGLIGGPLMEDSIDPFADTA
jgi:hypothetical protein